MQTPWGGDGWATGNPQTEGQKGGCEGKVSGQGQGLYTLCRASKGPPSSRVQFVKMFLEL